MNGDYINVGMGLKMGAIVWNLSPNKNEKLRNFPFFNAI